MTHAHITSPAHRSNRFSVCCVCGTLQSVTNKTSSGGVSINDVMMHFANTLMPFGGVGTSGVGCYHHVHGFKTFSHAKSVLHKSRYVYINTKHHHHSTLFFYAVCRSILIFLTVWLCVGFCALSDGWMRPCVTRRTPISITSCSVMRCRFIASIRIRSNECFGLFCFL